MIKTNNTTNLKNISKYLLTTTLTLGLLSATNTVIANQNSTIDNYNTRYTPQGRIKAGKRGTYKKDTHVWVYTSAFAKRFGMPQEWVDDELKGAEALAYRLDLDVYGTKCGYFSNVENCRPATACVVDMYIDDKANLPWNTNSRFESLTEENLILSLWHKRKKTVLHMENASPNAVSNISWGWMPQQWFMEKMISQEWEVILFWNTIETSTKT
ncbi:hypothetical protein BSPWISOXPB_7002 [uncultured Gammaproteobacteria bacterium]|nr:hypothetical protein BSPWISOXPB_7002 [uncultured Gammaproteobacteria bacterium]